MSTATETTRKIQKKKNYMLHDPATMKQLGKFSSTSPRNAAMKAASRGHTTILLRETGTKKMFKYTGSKTEMSTPREVHRDGKVITYKYESKVIADGKPFVYDGKVNDDEDVPEAPKAN